MRVVRPHNRLAFTRRLCGGPPLRARATNRWSLGAHDPNRKNGGGGESQWAPAALRRPACPRRPSRLRRSRHARKPRSGRPSPKPCGLALRAGACSPDRYGLPGRPPAPVSLPARLVAAGLSTRCPRFFRSAPPRARAAGGAPVPSIGPVAFAGFRPPSPRKRSQARWPRASLPPETLSLRDPGRLRPDIA